MVQNDNTYWMVLGSGKPNYRHPTEASARTEAARLAKLNPGICFTVLAAVSSITVDVCVEVEFGPLPSWLKMDQEMPF